MFHANTTNSYNISSILLAIRLLYCQFIKFIQHSDISLVGFVKKRSYSTKFQNLMKLAGIFYGCLMYLKLSFPKQIPSGKL